MGREGNILSPIIRQAGMAETSADDRKQSGGMRIKRKKRKKPPTERVNALFALIAQDKADNELPGAGQENPSRVARAGR